MSGSLSKITEIIDTLTRTESKNQNERVAANLVPFLREKKFFKVKYPLNDKDLLEVCNLAKYEMIEAGETIYNLGDQGDKCYIIIKGQVSV